MWTETKFDLRSGQYWQQLGWGLLIGFLSAAGAFVFIAIMDFGQGLLWPDLTNWRPFTGSWFVVGAMIVGGLLVGIIHHSFSANQPDVFDAVDQGYLDPKPVPASLLASLVSLVSGLRRRPEVPTGMCSAGLCS